MKTAPKMRTISKMDKPQNNTPKNVDEPKKEDTYCASATTVVVLFCLILPDSE